MLVQSALRVPAAGPDPACEAKHQHDGDTSDDGQCGVEEPAVEGHGGAGRQGEQVEERSRRAQVKEIREDGEELSTPSEN